MRTVTGDGLLTTLGEVDGPNIACPMKPATRPLIGEAELAAMSRGAEVVNVGRGAVIDEAAFIAALQRGHLAGAVLDVTEFEPLDAASPLWDLDNAFLAPHNADVSPHEVDRLVNLFVDNLWRYLRSEPLRNRFVSELGY